VNTVCLGTKFIYLSAVLYVVFVKIKIAYLSKFCVLAENVTLLLLFFTDQTSRWRNDYSSVAARDPGDHEFDG